MESTCGQVGSGKARFSQLRPSLKFGRKLLRSAVLTICVALVYAQPHGEPDAKAVRKITPACPIDASTAGRFDNFCAEFSKALTAQWKESDTSPWVFWVELREHATPNRARVFMSAKAGYLTVQVGNIRVKDATKRLPGLVQRCLAISRDPYLMALGTGDVSAMRGLQSGLAK